MPLSTAILGEDLRRDPEGGFSGELGGWTATKWFPELSVTDDPARVVKGQWQGWVCSH